MKKISTLVAALLLLFSNALSAQECVIKMKTAHAIGEYMGFSIQSNGNEVDIIGAEYQKDDGSFKVTAQEVELRGKITRLDCSSNWLESIDVSGNNLLVELYCDNNRLTDITLGQQPNLKELYVGDNQLASIDLSEYAQHLQEPSHLAGPQYQHQDYRAHLPRVPARGYAGPQCQSHVAEVGLLQQQPFSHQDCP